jgi:hypothetical protein
VGAGGVVGSQSTSASCLTNAPHAPGVAGKMGLMGESSPAPAQMKDMLGSIGPQLQGAPMASNAAFQAIGANVPLQAGPISMGHAHAWPAGGSIHMHQHNQVRNMMLTPVAVSPASILRPTASMSMAVEAVNIDAASPKSGAVIRPVASAVHANNVIDLTSEPGTSSAPAASKAAHGNQSAS